MDPARAADVMLHTLHRLGVEVREEQSLGAAGRDGGFCRIGGKPVVFLDPAAPPWVRARVLKRALREVGSDTIWLPPALRLAVSGER